MIKFDEHFCHSQQQELEYREKAHQIKTLSRKMSMTGRLRNARKFRLIRTV